MRVSRHRCILVMAALGLATVACGDQHAGSAGPAVPSSAAAPLSPPVVESAPYRSAVEGQVADRLRTTPDRIHSQLQSDPNASLMTLAKSVGLDLDQMGAIVTTALDDSADAAVNSGSWSALQADQEKHYWAAQSKGDLIAEVSRWFRQG